MSNGRKKSKDGPTIVSQAALVPDPLLARGRWNAERHAPFAEQPQRDSQPGVAPSYQDLIAVWLQLRGNWSWLAVVPAEPDYSTANVARALCQVGARLSVYPIEFIDANDVDLDSSLRLFFAQLGTSDGARGRPASADVQPFASSSWAPPVTKKIVALDSPLANPLALPVALAADGVVLYVRRGRDRIASVRRTIESVGADRILCCVLLE